MMCTGLLILEACVWMPKDANLITLTSRLLGRWGKTFCWILYLFLFSCLMVAHTSAGGSVLFEISNQTIPVWAGVVIYVLFFSPVVYLGTKWVDRLNLLLMAGVALTYLTFTYSSFSYIDFSLLTRSNWSQALWGIPVIFTAFGFQSLIPTLMTYLNRDIRKMRLAIILGTSIPFLMYVVWEMIILGIIPLEGPTGLTAALKAGQNAVNPLGVHLNNPTLLAIGQIFAFFAMTTSFVGISIAFVDFLADGLKVQKKGVKKLGLCALIFLIPMFIAILDPKIFFLALNYAGGLGVALLLGAIPILMVWAGRYYQGHSLLHQQLPGGKILLSTLMVFVAVVLAITLIV